MARPEEGDIYQVHIFTPIRARTAMSKKNMYFAIETFAGHPGLEQTVRLEENLVVTDKGYDIFMLCEHADDMLR